MIGLLCVCLWEMCGRFSLLWMQPFRLPIVWKQVIAIVIINFVYADNESHPFQVLGWGVYTDLYHNDSALVRACVSS